MKNINVNELLEKLIDLTKAETISWEYLDAHPSVCQALKLEGKSPIQNNNFVFTLTLNTLFDLDNSFFAQINNNYVIVYSKHSSAETEETLGERLVFMLVPRTFRDIFEIKQSAEGTALLRLHSLIKSKFPSASDIANDIFNM